MAKSWVGQGSCLTPSPPPASISRPSLVGRKSRRSRSSSPHLGVHPCSLWNPFAGATDRYLSGLAITSTDGCRPAKRSQPFSPTDQLAQATLCCDDE